MSWPRAGACASGSVQVLELVAMDRTVIERIGTYLEVDEQGFLGGVAGGAGIAAPWASVVEALVRRYVEGWGNDLHSVYVRGSVAKGLAVEGVSDLDSFAVVVSGPSDATGRVSIDEWARVVEEGIQGAFPFVAGVEVDVVPLEAALDRARIEAFVLKTQAVCVHGMDVADRTEPFVLGPEVAFQTRFFRQHLEAFVRGYAHEPVADRPGFLGWMLRRFLRLGMELVMVEEGRYTRDLYLCYESFAKHYPTQAGRMRRALELAVNPIADRESEAFVRSFGAWLAGEADRKLEAWGWESVT